MGVLFDHYLFVPLLEVLLKLHEVSCSPVSWELLLLKFLSGGWSEAQERARLRPRPLPKLVVAAALYLFRQYFTPAFIFLSRNIVSSLLLYFYIYLFSFAYG